MLSSVAGIIGATAQTNYAGGNAYQDALTRHRVGMGEKAISLDLGVILDDGILAVDEKLRTTLTRGGYFLGIRQRELYALLEKYCDPTLSMATPRNLQVVLGLDIPAEIRARGDDLPAWMNRLLFRHFHQMGGS